MPKVSVIIPSYNCSALVPAAIESVLAQSMRDCEIIVVNDGSTDDTEQVLRPYAEDGRIRYIQQENRGLPGARNAGAQAADCKYLAFLDADDTIVPEALQVMTDATDAANAAWCIIDSFRIRQAGSKEGLEVASSRPPEGDPLLGILRSQYLCRAMFYRRDDFFEVGAYDEAFRYMEDWDLYIRLFEMRKPFVYIDRPLYYYVWREGSIITRRREILAYSEEVCRQHHKRIADAGNSAAAKIYAAQMWHMGRCYLQDHKEYRHALACVKESLAYDVNLARLFHPFIHHVRGLFRSNRASEG